MRFWVLPTLALGCSGSTTDASDPVTTIPVDAPRDAAADLQGPIAVGLDPTDDLSGLAGLACADDDDLCAPPDVPWLGDTCCAFGEPLEPLDSVPMFEGVDVEVRDDLVVACTGFGPTMGRVAPDGALSTDFMFGVMRCQRIAIGPARGGGDRLVYLANHGDTFAAAALHTARAPGSGKPTLVNTLQEPGVLYEGLALFDDHLWVAAHGGGLRVYDLDGAGLPVFSQALHGFDNADRIVVDGDRAYVTDQDSIHVLDASRPGSPVRLATVGTAGKPRDIEADATHVFVPLGTEGLEVFARRGDTLESEALLDLDGSIQAVALHRDYLALAAWDHLALIERDGFERVGGAELRFEFEQTWGVALLGDIVVGLEWYALHTLRIRPGFVAPEVESEVEVIALDGTRSGERTAWLHNRGPLNAWLGRTETTFGSFGAQLGARRIPAGGRAPVRVRFDPPAHDPWTDPRLRIHTNDPGRFETPLEITLSARDTDLIDVGDPVPDAFGFLDPRGGGDVDSLRGRVTVLAYFALF